MTLHATRDGENITIHHSPSDTHVTEHRSHVRYFHSELGKLLDAAEQDAAAEASQDEPTGTDTSGEASDSGDVGL